MECTIAHMIIAKRNAVECQGEAGRQRKNLRLHDHNLTLCMSQLKIEEERMFDSGLVAQL